MRKVFLIKSIHVMLMFLISSCTIIQEIDTIGTSDSPDTMKSYLYGRFFQSALYVFRLGIIIQDVTTKKEYRIPFDHDRFLFFKAKEVLTVVLQPGTYRIKSFYAMKGDAFGPLIYEDSFKDQKFDRTIEIQSGKAYYIGDYEGKSYMVYYQRVEWFLSNVKDNYDTTTAKFREQYKKFDNIETVNIWK